jgi:hypothetical protein
MSKREKHEEQFARIMNMLADSELEMSDQEVVTEARNEGSDPSEEAERVRNTLQKASKAFAMRRLHDARRVYEEQVTRLRAKKYELPATPEKRRDLLAAVFAARPEMRASPFTAQYRDFRELSDADVESLLKQLNELGIALNSSEE